MTAQSDEEERSRSATSQGVPSAADARGAESGLRPHAEWLRIALASINDAVITTDAEDRVTFMNRAAEILTGWPQNEALGRELPQVLRLVDEHSRRPVERSTRRAGLVEPATAGSAQPILIANDGTERLIDSNTSPIHSGEDAVTGRVVVFRDVTERRRSAEALLESRADAERQRRGYEVILATTPDLAYVFDLSHRFIYANEALLKMWGRTWADAIGKNCLELGYEPAHAAMHDREIEQVIATKQSIRGVVPFTGTFGRRIYDYIFVPVLGEHGDVKAVAGTTRDITDRHQAEAALSRLAAIVDSSDDAIISKGLNGVITSWNHSAERMFGYTAEEAISRHISMIIPTDRRSEEDEVLSRLRRGEKIDHFETVRQAKNGRLLNISLTVSPVKDGTGRIIGASKVARDITERKQAEADREALLASERAARADAERAGRLKEEFLATLSHELRTPLSAILGWIQILRKAPPSPQTLDHGLSVIDRNARTQSQLIADLLDMSRIISGKMRLDVQRIELPVVIEAALDAVRPAAEAKDVRIQSVLEPMVDTVRGDPTRLQQVVWNLLSNAVKFTPRGGRVQVVLARSNSHIELSVSDTGRGIKAEFLPHVFERFRQADSSTAREHGGLGLGLSIVKQLVELHGGSARVASEGEGKGSTFTVQLPLAAVSSSRTATPDMHPRAAPLSPSECAPPGLAGVRVLVVDDEPDARDLVKRVLEECRAEVVLASSADEALAAAVRERLDVILSDIGLPGRDGYAFMAALRRTGNKVPAAALTAFARSEDRTRALIAGYQTHIAKPVESAELLATVASLAHKTTRGDRPEES